MTSDPVFVGVVDDRGALRLDYPSQFRAHLQRLKGEEISVQVKRRRSRSGDQQRRYYRGVVIPDIAEACGFSDPDDYARVHESLAWKFLRLPDDALGFPRRRSTSDGDMTHEERSRYLDQVITYAETSIPGCRIRRPEEIDDLEKVTVLW